ncbi:MAG: flagellar assembly protein FliX [Pseudomonadota bacterium]|nr:flagellar assembly protein FliX [Pseudomonadota bacterium]
MKVSRTRTASSVSAKKTNKTRSSDESGFVSHLSGPKTLPDDLTPAGEIAGVTSVGSILAAQEVNEDNGKKSQHMLRKYGEDILDRLDEIKHDILIGAIPKDRLQNLAQTLRKKKAVINDPKLRQIISDIELRAEVELAKYTRNK